jgi:EAL and modified HD-GYP domain-containing signal transduction protein
MKSFLQRVLPGFFGDETDRRKAPRSADTDRRKAAPSTLLVALGARRPVISALGEIVGFEFRISSDTQQRLKRRTDHGGQAAQVLAALNSARLMAQANRIGLARVSADWLVHAVGFEDAAGAWVGVEQPLGGNPTPAYLQATALAVQQLRQAGAKVGWETPSAMELTPDFVLLRQGDRPMGSVLEAIRAMPLALRALPTLVTDVASVEDLELALHRGLSFACGALAPNRMADDRKDLLPVPPEVARVGQLLGRLVSGADTAEIVADLKCDVGLSYHLLRRVNSAGLAQWEAGVRIDQALLTLGRDELYRWLSMLLVQFAGHRKLSCALQETALWRSRLLELLAVQANEAQSSHLFTLGLASVLGAILKISVADVIETLHLPDFARQALLEQAGPWYPYLQLVWLVESQGVDDASDLADHFGGTERVLALSDEAWAWAWRARLGPEEACAPAVVRE